MKYVEAVASINTIERPAVFLAGGITNCPDWQKFIVELMEDFPNGTILNPRRGSFDVNDKNASSDQIKWEFDMLWTADIIPFYFCKETLCPITLYELGAHLTRAKLKGYAPKIGIGIETGYARADDVWLQAKLAFPEVDVFDSAHALIELGGWIRREVRSALKSGVIIDQVELPRKNPFCSIM